MNFRKIFKQEEIKKAKKDNDGPQKIIKFNNINN